MHGTAWSPVAGDQRLAIAQDDRDRQRIAVWDLSTDGWSDVDLALPGDVAAVDWWPDASALLVIHAFEGRHELYRVDLPGGAARQLDTPPGSITDARVRPDGSVWFHHTDADNVDKLDPREVGMNVAAMAVMAYVVADLPEALARK